MDENLTLSKSFGILNHENYYEKKVSVSFDTIIHDENAEIKVLVQIEPPEVYDLTNSIIKNRKIFDLILNYYQFLKVSLCIWILWLFGLAFLSLE